MTIMLGIIAIAGSVFLTCAGSPINGYTLGNLNGGRGQEYSSGYRSGGFVGMKDAQGDYPEHVSSHRYSVVSGGSGYSSTPGSSYPSDSGYSDSSAVGGHLSGHGGQSGLESGDSSIGSSSSSYSSDLSSQAGTSELIGSSYSASGSSPASGNSGYSKNAAVPSINGNHVESGFVGYSETSGGGHGAVSSGKERGEYSSADPSSSYVSYMVGGPKVSTYTSLPGHGSHRHGISSFSSGPGISLSGGGNRGISSMSASSYPAEANHPGMTSGPSYSSGSSLNSFIANMHANGPSNYVQHGRDSHRGSPGHHHLFASASNPSAGYISRGPSSAYFSSNNGLYPRGNPGGGGKIIILKESNAGHHSGHMYPGEQHSYSNPMFGSPNGGYRIRNVGSGTSHGPPSFVSGYSSSGGGGYNGGSPSHSSNAGSFFGFL